MRLPPEIEISLLVLRFQHRIENNTVEQLVSVVNKIAKGW